jgi:tRNA1Val (adenine37-N6)-methyltransferase
MKPFQFKNFSIQQSKEVFRVGTDGVLLGALSNVENAKQIIEIGTGTGLVALMLAQRNTNANILALDIDENAVKISAKNFVNSPFSDRLEVQFKDFKNYESSVKFDLIVSNPPYFEENSSTKDLMARQQRELSFELLIEKSADILAKEGFLSVIIPLDAEAKFSTICKNFHLFLQRKVSVYGIQNSKVKRVILEYGRQNLTPIFSEIVIEKSPRIYTEEYLQLTKDFHLFSR